MSAVVADTQAAIWYVLNSPKLSPAALTALDQASQTRNPVYLSSMSIIETIYLIEKGKLPQQVLDELVRQVSDANYAFTLVEISLAIAQAVQKIPRTIVPELPDRVIAATALHLNLPLVSSDHKIQSTNLNVIW